MNSENLIIDKWIYKFINVFNEECQNSASEIIHFLSKTTHQFLSQFLCQIYKLLRLIVVEQQKPKFLQCWFFKKVYLQL